MTQSALNAHTVVIPPPAEQEAISNFLDRETAKIDALTEEQQRLIELLKEKRQAVISHAVTKGLDPNAPMKDSSVAWLGDVPAHWRVTKIGRHLNVLSGFAFPSNDFSTDEAHTRLLRGINVGVQALRWDEVVYWERKPGDNLERFELSSGDIVIGMDRPWIGDGTRIAILCDEDIPALLLQRVAKLTPDEELHQKFLYFLLQSAEFSGYLTPDMTGVSVPHISPEQIGAFLICLPPLSEQVLLVDFIERELRTIEDMTAISQSAIALFQERRSALISATVTGKIDVRNIAQSAVEAA